MEFIDLTIPLDVHTPIYPGDPKVTITQNSSVEKDGFTMHALSFGTHTGTHIDAPMHMIKNGNTLSSIPLKTFFGKGICIDVSKAYSLHTVQQYGNLKDSIVFLYTGWDKKIGTNEYYEKFPPIPSDICNFLVQAGVSLIGTDSPSTDDTPFVSHKILLENNIPIIESLIHLDSLLGKKFNVFALPLRVSLDGSPIRVIAQIV